MHKLVAQQLRFRNEGAFWSLRVDAYTGPPISWLRLESGSFNPAAKSYDQVPYEGFPFPQTHPDRLATIATLLGMKPAAPDDCRVLEIGCGEGENLAPMAYTLPASSFVGIDISQVALARGRDAIAALGLKNLQLQNLDVREVTPGFGTFDYIIAHGIYTWVPADVQERILSVCNENLAPNGVAYISYCCYPGGRIREMTRDILLFHTRNVDDPRRKVEQAMALGMMIARAGNRDDAYRQILYEELDRTTPMSQAALFHDELSLDLSHLYFHEFARRSGEHGLQFLAEADYFEMQCRSWPAEVVRLLQEVAQRDPILKEQYLDFLKCRRFRQTLLCHAGVPLQREPQPEQVVDFHVASAASSSSPRPELSPGIVVEFRGRKGASLATDHPLSKAALVVLGQAWPQAVSFRELLAEARKRLSGGAAMPGSGLDEDAMVMAEILLRGYESGLVELHLGKFPLVTSISEKPRASAFARWQLQTRNSVTTLRHSPLNVEDALGRHLIQLLDGTRDQEAIVAELTPLVTAGLVAPIDQENRVDQPERAAALIQEQLESKLAQLARLGLLEA